MEDEFYHFFKGGKMKIFLDIGSHYGETLSVIQQSKYGFDRIYCFEPIFNSDLIISLFLGRI